MKRIVFDVPRWHLYLHREARGIEAASPSDPNERRFEDELFERLYAGEGERLPESDWDPNGASWAGRLHEVCSGLPDFERLTSQCRGDADAAAIATEELLRKLGPLNSDAGDDAASRAAIRSGCARAAEAVEHFRESASGVEGVSFGRKAGTGSGTSSPRSGGRARALASRLRQDDRLRRIALLAGRFKRILARKRRERVRHGADELTDIELGSDLPRLLPSELARLNHPTLRLAMLRDLTERRCLQYRLEGAESKGRGPLVVCVDKSGSMDGQADIWATAVALALLDVAQQERRPFSLLCFDDRIRYQAYVEPGGKLPEEALFVSCSGGTDVSICVGAALEVIQTATGAMSKADIVLITDGESDSTIAPALRERAGRMGVSILGFGIGIPPAALEPWCDEVHAVREVNRLEEDVAGSMVGR